jgi:phosphoribosylformimino-5-aminoimidazole carboxamide ribotide isomerase
MLVFPAIDLREGVCVRLVQGRFDAATDYGDPFMQLRAFADAGAAWVHIVDLDGARLGRPVQGALIARLVGETSLSVQCGGGVRTRADVKALLDAGVTRVVVGSVAVRAPAEARAWITEFGAERVCVALDVRARGEDYCVAVDGWAGEGGRTLPQALAEYQPGLIRYALVTDIARDGALAGPNLELMRQTRAARPDIQLQASGGVTDLSDLMALKKSGVGAVIVGRALFEQRFTLEDALAI